MNAAVVTKGTQKLAEKTPELHDDSLRRSPEWIPILKRHGVYLFCIDGDGRRFADLFARTWKQLPLGCRRKLLTLWRSKRPTIEIEAPWPPIELIDNKSNFSRGNSGRAIAQYTAYAYSFAFHSRFMDRLSDASVMAVIAHELAHAILIIDDREYHLSNVEYDGFGLPQAELDADELAEIWGFDIEGKYEELEQLPPLSGE